MTPQEQLTFRERLARPLAVIAALGSLGVSAVVINYSSDPQTRPIGYVAPELACGSPDGPLPGPDLETPATVKKSIPSCERICTRYLRHKIAKINLVRDWLYHQ